MLLFVVTGLFLILFAGLLEQLENSQAYLKINRPYQRFKGSMWALHFSILQHFHLRYLLYKKDLLPKRLVTFLQEATKNNILESDGGSWRFRHRILQDCFAEHWRLEYEENQKVADVDITGSPKKLGKDRANEKL